MGQRGPRKKLAAIERLEGNPGKRPIDDSGIEAGGEFFVPEHLSDDARGCLEVIKLSMPAKIYAALDSFLLSAFATAWSLHKEAALQISAPDFAHLTLNASGSPIVNPWHHILNKQAGVMASLGDRLGLDPKARAALKLPSERPSSKFDGLMGHERDGEHRAN